MFAGLDVGSLTTKAVILDGENRLLSFRVLLTGAHGSQSARKALEDALSDIGKSPGDVSFMVATGYGRDLVQGASKRVTEITCHARGAAFAHPGTRTVIDIGGQDAKVMVLDRGGGAVLDFVMNDKCAAGTGRFLQVMAEAMEVSVEELAPLSAQVSQGLPISSMCTVFAESEVISLLAQGSDVRKIARGLHDSVAKRVGTMAKRLDIEEDVLMTGGVARNRGVVDALSRTLKTTVLVPENPQIMGALGAALIARDMGKDRQATRYPQTP